MDKSRDKKWKEIYEIFCQTNTKTWSVKNLKASISVSSNIRDLILVNNELMSKDDILIELMKSIAPSNNDNNNFDNDFKNFNEFLDLVINLRNNIEDEEEYEETKYYEWNKEIEDIVSKAVALKRMGKYKDAMQIYVSLDNEYPKNPNIYYGLAKVVALDGLYDDSLNLFKDAKRLYEFYDNENGKPRIDDCEHFIDILENCNRDSKDFSDFLKSINGGI